ncbi:MAG: transcription antitermination factor NusB [Verrucomicrobia bacterium]|nr:transcription antitermination factor NusB [Verrucomicrobiota bacterium]
MASRRQLREQALQLLFELDMNTGPAVNALERFWSARKPGTNDRQFVDKLVLGVREKLAEIDAVVTGYAKNWDIKRMAVVDRNVLRMAIFEMLHCKDVPAVVVINEAVDIAKYFSSAESGRFVNGILDRFRKDMEHDATPAAKSKPVADK